jgi:hypothetical protein
MDLPRGLGKLDAAGVGLFLMAAAESFNVFSALNSSPWTSENFGADPEKAKSCREYVRLSVLANTGLGFGTSLLARSWWPLIGTSVVSIWMAWVYERALRRGAITGSTGWAR